MGMSRLCVLGALVPLVAGCGGGSSNSDDGRQKFLVNYAMSASSETENGLPLFTKLDVVCTGTRTVDGVEQSVTLDLGIDVPQVAFSMSWINNEFNSQNLTLTGDGFKVVITQIDDADGARTEVWDSDFNYSAVNAANGNDGSARYFESVQHSGTVLDDTVDTTVYDCNDNWQSSLVGEDTDNQPDPFQFRNSGGDVIGNHNGVSVGDDDSYEVILPQSEQLPSGGSGYRDGAGGYLWHGFDRAGQAVPVEATYEAVLEARVCLTGIECEVKTETFQFRIANKST